ncbi:MAG: amidophosphoribosyltransferase, partial [Candidatus Helarchaeota archaeon]
MCGIFGISCNDYSYSVASLIYPGLMAIQHRGQNFSGIATTNCDGKISSYQNKGLVSKILTPIKLKEFLGNVGIGHVGCSRQNLTRMLDAQPYHLKTEEYDFAIVFNGYISNYDDIRKRMDNIGRIFTNNTDIELIATLIESFLKFSDDIIETLKILINILEGCYCIILLEPDGTLYAIRDPTGIKPLCYGTLELNNKFFHVITSESCALDAIGGILEGDVEPGEILKINII